VAFTSTSTDPDGTIDSYAWDFGDNNTSTLANPVHAYDTGGIYTVTLTVTDNDNATDTTTKQVTVTAPPTQLALDTFERSITNGLGTATIGGNWTLVGSSTLFGVTDGKANIRMAGAGSGPSAYLNSVSSASSDMAVTVGLDKSATGGGTYISLVGRRVVATSGDYRFVLRYLSSGAVQPLLIRRNGSTDNVLASLGSIPGLTVAPGDELRVRFQVEGTNPTQLRVKVWRLGTPEPVAWLLSATDSNTALQSAGGVGLVTYLSGSATNAPVTARFDDLVVANLP
jgi:PKD repeat protein